MIEAGWIDSGKRIMFRGHTILYSGQTDYQHRGAVAIIVTRKVEISLEITKFHGKLQMEMLSLLSQNRSGDASHISRPPSTKKRQAIWQIFQ